MTKRKTKLPPLSAAAEAALQQKIAGDLDDAEATDEEMAQARPFAEALPEVASAMKRSRGRPRVDQPKE